MDEGEHGLLNAWEMAYTHPLADVDALSKARGSAGVVRLPPHLLI